MLIRPLSLADRLAVRSWNYSQELDTYSGEEIAPGDPDFFAVYDGDSFIGFGVTGFHATVQGLELTSTDLDVGLGMAPDFIRNGRGREFSKTVLEYATQLAKEYGFNYLRCAIHSWNTVPQLMAKRAGFQPIGRITNDSGEFIIMRKEIG